MTRISASGAGEPALADVIAYVLQDFGPSYASANANERNLTPARLAWAKQEICETATRAVELKWPSLAQPKERD